MMPDQHEHSCLINSLTPDGAIFFSDFVPEQGQFIVAYSESLGRLEGISAQGFRGGFHVEFPLAGARRERLAAKLAILEDGRAARRHLRIIPKSAKTMTLLLGDKRSYACEILDVSLTGAGVKVHVIPALGMRVVLGVTRGRIVRHLENGVAIEFINPLEDAQLAAHID